MIPPRLRAGLVLSVVVLGSAVAGAAIDRTLLMRRSSPSVVRADSGQRRGGGGPNGGRGGGRGYSGPEGEARRRNAMLDRLTRDLVLTPPQRAGIDSIMRRTDSSLRVIRQEMQPRLHQVFEASRTQISERLTPEQREKFAKKGSGPHRGGP
jgi:Spy/CpxP family protein refolding chaperone